MYYRWISGSGGRGRNPGEGAEADEDRAAASRGRRSAGGRTRILHRRREWGDEEAECFRIDRVDATGCGSGDEWGR